jgi:hypothetical protein
MIDELHKRFKALKFIQTRAIYKHTGYSKYAVHQYLNDTLDAPEKFLKRFEMMIEEYEHTQKVLDKHLEYIA